LAYRYCSGFVHTTFFTVEQLERIDATTGKGLAPFTMIANVTNVFLLLLIRDYTKAFPDLASVLSVNLSARISDSEEFAKKTTADWISAVQANRSSQ